MKGALLAAGAVAVLGTAGLVRGAMPAHAPAAPSASQIVVSGAYVRQPASPDVAAAYLRIDNVGGTPDTLLAAQSGAGLSTSVHLEQDGAMLDEPQGVPVPAHGSVVLGPGKGHIMIDQLVGPLLPGQTVNLTLTFARSGPVLVTAPVIGVFAPVPSGAPR